MNSRGDALLGGGSDLLEESHKVLQVIDIGGSHRYN